MSADAPKEDVQEAEDQKRKFANRRAFPRYESHATVLCRLDEWGMRPPVGATLVTVSQGGCSMKMSQPPKAKGTFIVEITPVGRGKPLVLPAKPVKIGEEEDGQFFVACQFEKRLSYDALRQLIYKRI